MKKKQTFILKLGIIITSVYLIVFLYIEFFPTYYNNVNNTRWHISTKILNKKIDISDTSISLLVLGESRVNAGLDLTKIPNSWSFASGGTTPVEMYFVLEKYLETYQKPDTIFLSISARFLSEILAFWDYGVRNNFINYNNFIKIEKNRKNYKVLGFFPLGKFFLYKMNFINFYQADFFTNRVCFAKSKNKKMLAWVLNNNGQRLHEGLKNSCSELNYETKYENFNTPELFDFYFNEIFETCKNKNIYIFFDFMPMNKSSEKKLNTTFIQEYKKYIQSYQKKYLEFSISDTLIFYDDSFFGDPSHLNIKGQAKYTKYFLKLKKDIYELEKRHNKTY